MCCIPTTSRRDSLGTIGSLCWMLKTDRPSGVAAMNLHELTGKELDQAYESADYLLGPVMRERLDASLRVKLDTLRADLGAEQEDRRKLAKH